MAQLNTHCSEGDLNSCRNKIFGYFEHALPIAHINNNEATYNIIGKINILPRKKQDDNLKFEYKGVFFEILCQTYFGTNSLKFTTKRDVKENNSQKFHHQPMSNLTFEVMHNGKEYISNFRTENEENHVIAIHQIVELYIGKLFKSIK